MIGIRNLENSCILNNSSWSFANMVIAIQRQHYNVKFKKLQMLRVKMRLFIKVTL